MGLDLIHVDVSANMEFNREHVIIGGKGEGGRDKSIHKLDKKFGNVGLIAQLGFTFCIGSDYKHGICAPNFEKLFAW